MASLYEIGESYAESYRIVHERITELRRLQKESESMSVKSSLGARIAELTPILHDLRDYRNTCLYYYTGRVKRHGKRK